MGAKARVLSATEDEDVTSSDVIATRRCMGSQAKRARHGGHGEVVGCLGESIRVYSREFRFCKNRPWSAPATACFRANMSTEEANDFLC